MLAPATFDSLVSLMQCPCCGSGLTRQDTCDACGTEFPIQDGVRSYIPENASREVTYTFTSRRSTPGPEFEAALHYPEQCGASGGVYHLDRAHLAVMGELHYGARILEIGCGGGQMRDFVAHKGISYVGVDISANERVTEDLKQFGGPDLLADAHFLPFADNSFDLVYSSALTEHLASPYLVAQEVFRVLKPGGYYLGNGSFLEPWHDASYFHMSVLGAFEFLTQAGFKVDNVWPGKGYSGFRALMTMGNRITQKTVFLGEALHSLYKLGNALRGKLKGEPRTIVDDARISGATDWIAHKSAPTELVRLRQIYP
jgi:ubiquinone/menaquinone biosynthesis C-methylase UbiE